MLLLAAPYLGPERYSVFAAFWSALYLGVGSLFGIQQEVTRDTSARSTEKRAGPRLILVGLSIGGLIAATVLATSPLWSFSALGSDGVGLAGLIALGLVLYSGHVVVAGALAGSGRWTAYSGLLVAEAVARFALVVIVCSIPLWGGSIVTLAAATIAAMGAWTVMAVLPAGRAALGSRSSSSFGTTLRRFGQTAGASVASALLVTGFPFLITLTWTGDATTSGIAILALTLTRAPVLLPLNALLGMLIGAMSRQQHRVGEYAVKGVLVVAAATTVFAVAGFFVGNPLIRWAFGEEFDTLPQFLVGCIIATGFVAVLTITGAGLLSLERHTGYLTGWIVAAIVSFLVLVLPVDDLFVRVVASLIAGPSVGIVIHVVRLRGAVSRHPDRAS